ncbi:MAG: M48 family metallopeptidase [Thiomicrospira sp.]
MRIKALWVGIVSLSLVGCVTTQTTQSGLVGIERQQMFMVSQSEMIEGSEQAYAQVLQKAQEENKLNKDSATLARLQRIMQDLIPHTAQFRAEAINWDWQVNLISEDTLNAWIMPGGRIMFYTGLIHKLALSDDEVAAIMGHEMAHDLREHARERASQAQMTQLGLGLVGQLAGVDGMSLDLAATVINVAVLLPFSRVHEVEADRIGIELAARAGYDPAAAVGIWQRMAALSTGGSTPEFLSTHPSYDSRIKDLTEYAKRLQPTYEQAKAARKTGE